MSSSSILTIEILECKERKHQTKAIFKDLLNIPKLTFKPLIEETANINQNKTNTQENNRKQNKTYNIKLILKHTHTNTHKEEILKTAR